ncbi:MAG TPA: ABC transporter permease [Candidatus Latescibacteria bacterium]|nr:ABC transporter permease [Candidatus Latescibacterota bacterium]
MRNMLAIFQKEMRSYFISPIAYVLAAVFLVISGYFFYGIVVSFSNQSLYYVQYSSRYGMQMPPLNLNEQVIRGIFGLMSFISLFMIPMLTMRLYAEEKRSGTIELLMTSPLTTVQTLLGKFLACFVLYVLIIALTVIFMVILEIYGSPEWGPIISSYIGTLLMGAAFISVGIFASSLTENQIVAVVISFGALLMFWVIGSAVIFTGPGAGRVFSYLSIIEHIVDFHKGVIDTKDAVFYLSFTGFFLFLTYRTVESRSWR